MQAMADVACPRKELWILKQVHTRCCSAPVVDGRTRGSVGSLAEGTLTTRGATEGTRATNSKETLRSALEARDLLWDPQCAGSLQTPRPPTPKRSVTKQLQTGHRPITHVVGGCSEGWMDTMSSKEVSA